MFIQTSSNQATLAPPLPQIRDAATPVPATPSQPATHPDPSAPQLKVAVDSLNLAMQQANQNLEFSVDPGTHRSVVKVVDTETGELLRQIPSKKALAIAQEIGRWQQGLLLNQKA